MATEARNLSGVVGFFSGPGAILKAMEKVKATGFEKFDAFTPFPVHGMDDAMGIKRSVLPYITLVGAITGLTIGFSLEYWTSAVDWPLNVGGKPFNSWPAFVPVMFELTILLAGLSTVFGMFALNRLPNLKDAAFDPGITRDRFAIWIGVPCDLQQAESLLNSLGATDVRKVYQEGWF